MTYRRVLFDIRLDTQLGDNDMASSMKRLIEINNQNSLLAGLRDLNPFFHLASWRAQRYNLSFFSSNSSVLDASIRKQVDAHRKSTSDKRWKSGTGDILDLALSDAEYGKQATTSEIIDQMKSFFFAGNDTTSSMLSWTYVFLHRYPSVLAKLRKELDDVFGLDTSPDEVAQQIKSNPKLLNQLEYTLAVVRETLRIEPPAQMIRAAPSTGYEVITRSGNKYVLEPGLSILINSYQMARNKQIWGDDAEEFNPERFMTGSIPTAFMSFSKRPRDCIGTNLAYMEVFRWFRGLI
jgi:cytochrome P450